LMESAVMADIDGRSGRRDHKVFSARIVNRVFVRECHWRIVTSGKQRNARRYPHIDFAAVVLNVAVMVWRVDMS
jgi:hypothetical protein